MCILRDARRGGWCCTKSLGFVNCVDVENDVAPCSFAQTKRVSSKFSVKKMCSLRVWVIISVLRFDMDAEPCHSPRIPAFNNIQNIQGSFPDKLFSRVTIFDLHTPPNKQARFPANQYLSKRSGDTCSTSPTCTRSTGNVIVEVSRAVFRSCRDSFLRKQGEPTDSHSPCDLPYLDVSMQICSGARSLA